MDEPKPQPNKPTPKAFDVFSPGQTPASSTSRPIIVSHKTMAQDSMVTGNKEVIASDHPEEPKVEEHQHLMDTHEQVSVSPPNSSSDQENKQDSIPASELYTIPPLEDNQPQTPAEVAPVTEETQPPVAEVQNPPTSTPSEPVPAQGSDQQLEIGNSDNTPPTGGALSSHPDAQPVVERDPELDAHKIIVSHHKTSRQRTVKRVLIVSFAIVIVAAACGVLLWKQSQ